MTEKIDKLSRREREIINILFQVGEATAEQVRERLTDPPSNSAARALLARLEKKGVIRHIERDLKYVYAPVVSRNAAKKSALARLIRVFYDGSLAAAVTGMVEQSGKELTDEELQRLEDVIRQARKRRQR